VTDFKLLGLDGLQFVKKIHATNARLPIIFITAHGTADLAIEATRWGAYDCLFKPFEMPDLLATVANAVAHNVQQWVMPSCSPNAASVNRPLSRPEYSE
jgi:DNA-binding NtrC family response regulator